MLHRLLARRVAAVAVPCVRAPNRMLTRATALPGAAAWWHRHNQRVLSTAGARHAATAAAAAAAAVPIAPAAVAPAAAPAKACCAKKAAAETTAEATAEAGARGAASTHALHSAEAASAVAGARALPWTAAAFWADRGVWARAAVNTLHCLVGCSVGDLGAVYALSGTALPMHVLMPIAMASGVGTSLALETLRLRFGRDRFGWRQAAATAWRMSLISMLTMESAENAVALWIGGGGGAMAMADASSPLFWPSLAASLTAGFLAPLPYNYYALKRYARSCH